MMVAETRLSRRRCDTPKDMVRRSTSQFNFRFAMSLEEFLRQT